MNMIRANESWADIRSTVMRRDGGRCVECDVELRSPEAHIHHLIPRAFGGTNSEDNLVTLCTACHAGKHRNLQVGLGRRLMERWAWRLARWLDRELVGRTEGEKLGAVMRLFGVTRLRPGQLDAILAALRGESVLFVSPTGSGKSFCFQAPTTMQRGTALVISPLKALMSDQVGGLHRKRIPASFINGDLSPDEKKLRYDLLRRGALKFLYCAPERFDRSGVRAAEVDKMEQARPSFFVVDEAHCIDKWGDAFRPNYSRLGAVRHKLGDPPVLAFTATASPGTRERILKALDVPTARVILHDVDRPNISLLRLDDMSDQKRFDVIAAYMKALRHGVGGKALIFVPTIKKGQEIEASLRDRGIEAPVFRGKLQPKVRDYLQGRFDGRLSPPLDLMICTSAFGMGIDIPDIRLVFHWQHPASIEDYLQEFGRAGRDQKSSLAVLFRTKNDMKLLEWMLDKTLQGTDLSLEEREAVRQAKSTAIKEMHELANQPGGCFRDGIRQSLGDTQRRRSTFAMRVLEWVFVDRVHGEKVGYCCDACANLRTSTGKQAWGVEIIQRMATISRFPASSNGHVRRRPRIHDRSAQGRTAIRFNFVRCQIAQPDRGPVLRTHRYMPPTRADMPAARSSASKRAIL